MNKIECIRIKNRIKSIGYGFIEQLICFHNSDEHVWCPWCSYNQYSGNGGNDLENGLGGLFQINHTILSLPDVTFEVINSKV